MFLRKYNIILYSLWVTDNTASKNIFCVCENASLLWGPCLFLGTILCIVFCACIEEHKIAQYFLYLGEQEIALYSLWFAEFTVKQCFPWVSELSVALHLPCFGKKNYFDHIFLSKNTLQCNALIGHLEKHNGKIILAVWGKTEKRTYSVTRVIYLHSYKTYFLLWIWIFNKHFES